MTDCLKIGQKDGDLHINRLGRMTEDFQLEKYLADLRIRREKKFNQMRKNMQKWKEIGEEMQ